ncbi:MAG: Galactose-1-phosphate uridylyltransferase [Clostridia bacterium 62_21]|nr:MAG: Galactose-1-phosphate uridylyltransferase [Clostridia bacterium 62_21]HAG06552.1 galactose-1-phosphate uridylyltransferase [Peptococcaceae bacterium]
MPEWRKDILTGRWVVIAAERGKRPLDFKVRRDRRAAVLCPLCPGHERETPPEVAAYRPVDTPPDTPGWRVRVVPNKFPAVRGEGPAAVQSCGIYRAMPGIGVHEMVIEAPEHVRGFEDLDPEQVAAVLRMWQERSRALRRLAWIKYIQVFKNTGQAAGASLEHTHSQIVALPLVPDALRAELAGMAEHVQATGECPLCAMLRQEAEDGSRMIVQGRHAAVFAPFASRFPFEVWAVPRAHQEDFALAGEAVIRELAHLLRDVLGRLAGLLGSPPYNLVLHTAPVNSPCEHYHWHVEVLPRLAVCAGFEFGTGCYINPVAPEAAARHLREAGKSRAKKS